MKKIYFFWLGCVALMFFSACGNNQIKKNSEKQTEKSQYWLTTWSQAQKGIGLFPVNDNGRTVEYQIPIQNSGDKIKLTLGNYYSEESLKIDNVSISTKKNEGFKKVTVEEKQAFTIKAKELVKTDPIDLAINSGESVYVRIYYAEQSEKNRAVSGNTFSTSIERSVIGDFANKNTWEQDDTYVDSFSNDPYALKYADALEQYKMRFTLTIEGVDVQTEKAGGTIVAFGDSITEQSHWVDPLQKEVIEKLGEDYSVVNAGISGNRLLKDIANLPRRTQYFGLAGIDRFEHDVFDTNKQVSSVIVSLGVNDLHQPGTEEQFPIEELPTFEEMISGYEQLIKQTKKHESKIFLATISPFIGYTKDIKNEEKEELRQKVNAWIRKNTEVDGIYDFDQVLADPKDPTKLNSSYDSGDKLHPSEAGGAQMAKTIDVDAFKR